MSQKSSGDLRRISPARINRLAFGVRYEPQFAVLDHLGVLVDEILRSEGTPFGPDVFPQTNTSLHEYRLVNPDNQNTLRVNQQDAILIWNFETRNLEEVLKWAAAFQTYVLNPLREVGVRNIDRYGMILRLNYQSGTLQNPPIARYVAGEFAQVSNLTTLAMRFTRRLATNEALSKRSVDDYRNVIYTLEESEKGEVQISVDYQEYFKPMLDASDWAKRPLTKFASEGLTYFEGEFTSWLRAFQGVPEVA